MNFISYIISYPFIWLFSRLPMRVLYVISDILHFFIFYVIGYRKKVVISNLKTAFPTKSKEEITKLSKQFYHHFIDFILESIKSISISKKEVSKRQVFKNPEVINDLSKQGKGIMLVGAHQANWEWFCSSPLVLDTTVYATYSQLSNPYFNKILKQTRSKFGTICIKTTETVKVMHKNFLNNSSGLHLLLSDQSPMVHKTLYWKDFFGVNVPVHTGAEVLAKRFDYAVVYYAVKKIKRGYYEAEFKLITDTPKAYENFEITRMYLAMIEQEIKEQPSYYLWTHKRFKHKDKYDEWLHLKKNK